MYEYNDTIVASPSLQVRSSMSRLMNSEFLILLGLLVRVVDS